MWTSGMYEFNLLQAKWSTGLMKKIQAGSSMSGSGVSKNGCVLSSSGTKGSTKVGCLLPRNFKHLETHRSKYLLVNMYMAKYNILEHHYAAAALSALKSYCPSLSLHSWVCALVFDRIQENWGDSLKKQAVIKWFIETVQKCLIPGALQPKKSFQTNTDKWVCFIHQK